MKPDAIQIELLEKNIDIRKVSFREIVLILSKYLQKIVEENFKCRNIDEEFFFLVKDMHQFPDEFFTGAISSNVFYQARVKAWRFHDAEKNLLKKRIIRAIICCLYEEYSESGDKYEVDEMIELFFSVLLNIDEKYCCQFRVFFEQALSGLWDVCEWGPDRAGGEG